MTVEDRETNPDQRRAGIALEIFSIGIANQEIHWLREQERAHVPQVPARINAAVLAERRAVKQRLNLRFPGLAAIGCENMGGFRAKFEQETGKTQAQIRIAIKRKFLTMDMRA